MPARALMVSLSNHAAVATRRYLDACPTNNIHLVTGPRPIALSRPAAAIM